MDPQQIALVSTVGVGGLAVLASYSLIYLDYTKHDYWVGITQSSQHMFYAFWVLAALGFIWYIVSHVALPTPDHAGLFSYGTWIRPLIVGIVLLGSCLWSVFVWCTFNKQWSKVWASGILVVVGLCTLLLLAGEAEAQAPWYRIAGLMLFAMTTVLIDPVMWNAQFILHPVS